MDKEYKNLLTGICIKANTQMVSLLDTANTIGLMAVFSKEPSKTDSGMAKEYGKEDRETAINIKELTKAIKNGGMEYSHGQAGTHIKETTKETYETGTVRCTGTMVATIKVNG
jgi:hypothetical protein